MRTLSICSILFASAAFVACAPASGQESDKVHVSLEKYSRHSIGPALLEAALRRQVNLDEAVKSIDGYARFNVVASEVSQYEIINPAQAYDHGELVCGASTEEPLWLVGPDDASGTPIDWTRRAMLASTEKPLQIFAADGGYASIILGAQAARDGIGIQVSWTSSDAASLMEAKRAGDGLAMIEARHANAHGFGLVLDLNGFGTADAPSLSDLGFGPVPSRVTLVYVEPDSAEPSEVIASRACATFGDQAIDHNEAVAWLAQLETLKEAGGAVE